MTCSQQEILEMRKISHKLPKNFLLAKIGGFPGSKISKSLM